MKNGKKHWSIHEPTTDKRVERVLRIAAKCLYWIARLYKVDYITMFTFWKDGCTDVVAKRNDKYVVNEAWV